MIALQSSRARVHSLLAAGLIAVLSGCGGGGGGGGDGGGDGGNSTVPSAPTGLSIAYDVKGYSFTWDAVEGATHYRLFEDADGPGPQEPLQVGKDLTISAARVSHSVLLHERLNANYTVRSCNTVGCSASAAEAKPDIVKAIGYFKASNSDESDFFGLALSLSADGRTLAVASPNEASAASGVNGNEDSNGLPASGAVYVYASDAVGTWSKQAYLKAKYPGEADGFGTTLALSADGSTLAISALGEDSGHTGVVPADVLPDEEEVQSGAVYVFARVDGAWSQQAFIKASNAQEDDSFGWALSLSADGSTLAVGAPLEDGDNNAIDGAGAVYVYVRSDAAWSFEAMLSAENAQEFGLFGSALALSANGKTMAVGSTDENTHASDSGAVYIFVRDDTQWTQQKFLKASNPGQEDLFGYAVALSADGNTLAVGAPWEASAAKGVGGNQLDDSKPLAGAVYVFVREGTDWNQRAYIKASNTEQYNSFGLSVGLSADGNTLAIGADGESSPAVGINGVEANKGAPSAGAAYLFTRVGPSWSQKAYLKASNTSQSQAFGTVLAMSGDGSTLAVGAYRESGGATGINGDQAAVKKTNAGAVYLY